MRSYRSTWQRSAIFLPGVLVVCLSGCVAPSTSPRWDATELQQAIRQITPAPFTETLAPPATESATDGSLVTILRLVAAQSPLVEAARRRWLAATYKRPQVMALPDPKLEYRYFARQMAPEETQWELGLSQEIPYPGKLLLAGKIADTEAEVAYVRYQIALRNAFAEAKEAYWEMYYIDRALEITADIEALYTRYAALAVGGTAVAQPRLPERFRAESQRTQLGYDLVLLKEMRTAEMARLGAVTGVRQGWQTPSSPPLAQVPVVIFAFEALQAQAERLNQELTIAGLEVERTHYQTQLARRTPIPDVMLSATYMRTGSMRDSTDPTQDPITVGIGVSLPLWGGKYRAMVHEARHTEQAAAAEHTAQHVQVRADLARAYFSLHNARRLVQLYRDTLLPQARQALQSAEELYRIGNASLAAVLETTATLHNFELARQRATADFYQRTHSDRDHGLIVFQIFITH